MTDQPKRRPREDDLTDQGKWHLRYGGEPDFTDDDVMLDYAAAIGEWTRGDCVSFAVQIMGADEGSVTIHDGRASWKEPCHRCGGAGGSSAWPGFTCFRCGGAKSIDQTNRNIRNAVRKQVERINNDRAGRGRWTDDEVARRDESRLKYERLMSQRRAGMAEAGIDPERWTKAKDLWLRYAQSSLFNEHGDEDPNPEFDPEVKKAMGERLYNIALDIALKANFGLSEKQANVILKSIEQIETARDRVAAEKERRAAIVIEEGRYEVEGEVFWAKAVEGPYGCTLKMGIKTDSGASLFGTNNINAAVGDRVRITATIAPTGKPGTGSFKRPKGQVIRCGS